MTIANEIFIVGKCINIELLLLVRVKIERKPLHEG